MNATSDNCKVLIVDDDSLSRQLVSRILSRAGFATATARSGDEALAFLAAENFALVVSDVIMPRMSGFELLRHIRTRHPWLPVILMSALDQDQLRDAAAAGGAVAVFEQPLDRAALVLAAESAIAGTSPLLPSEAWALAGQQVP